MIRKAIPALIFLALAAAAVAGVEPPYDFMTLPNGLQVILVEDHRQPLVALSLLIKSGDAIDPPDLGGLAAMTAQMIRTGSKNFPGLKLYEAFDSIGSQMTVIERVKDGLCYQGYFLSRDFPYALRLFSDMAINPTMNEDAMEKIRRRYLSSIMQAKTVGSAQLGSRLHYAFYGDSGFGILPAEREAGLKKIKLSDITDFYRNNFHPSNAALIIVGDIKKSAVRESLKKTFGPWSAGGKTPPIPTAYHLPDSLRIVLIDNPSSTAANFMIGRPAVPVGTRDFAELVLLNYILGGGGRISRLYQNLIADNSLATVISSDLEWSRGNGMLSISGSTTEEAMTDAIRQVLSVIDEMRSIRIPLGELEEAKRSFDGSIPARFETAPGAMANLMSLLEFGTRPDYFSKLLADIKGIDPDRLKGIAENYLNPDHMVLVVFGSAASLRVPLSALGKIEEVAVESK